MKESWFIIADDFTGAGDSAVQFSGDHAPSRLIVRAEGAALHVSGHAAIVVDTDSRYLAGGAAFETVRKVAAGLASSGARRFFKKIDSTLRGNIAEEVDAVMQGAGLSAALVCSAAPRNGRTIIDGLCLVGGLPVGSGQTVKDRFTPVLDASVAHHFESRFPGSIARIPLDLVRTSDSRLADEVKKLMSEGARIFIADAQTMDDLGSLASLSNLPGLLMVGSSGLAQAIADREKVPVQDARERSPVKTDLVKASEMLFLVGSITPTSIAQCETLAAEGSLRRIMIDTEAALANPDQAAAKLAQTLETVPRELGILLQTDTTVPSLTAEAARARGKAVSNICARLALVAIRTRNLRFAFASGGDTAAQVAAALGAEYIDFTKELLPGLPFGAFHSVTLGRPLLFASKSGGFGGPQTLVELMRLVSIA